MDDKTEDAIAVILGVLRNDKLCKFAAGLDEIANRWEYGEVRVVIQAGDVVLIKVTRSED
jgi:hypothetical protein